MSNDRNWIEKQKELEYHYYYSLWIRDVDEYYQCTQPTLDLYVRRRIVDLYDPDKKEYLGTLKWDVPEAMPCYSNQVVMHSKEYNPEKAMKLMLDAYNKALDEKLQYFEKLKIIANEVGVTRQHLEVVKPTVFWGDVTEHGVHAIAQTESVYLEETEYESF